MLHVAHTRSRLQGPARLVGAFGKTHVTWGKLPLFPSFPTHASTHITHPRMHAYHPRMCACVLQLRSACTLHRAHHGHSDPACIARWVAERKARAAIGLELPAVVPAYPVGIDASEDALTEGAIVPARRSQHTRLQGNESCTRLTDMYSMHAGWAACRPTVPSGGGCRGSAARSVHCLALTPETGGHMCACTPPLHT